MRRYLCGKKAKYQMRLGDGVISREDMFLDLRRENITGNYVQGERHLRDILERDWMTSLTTWIGNPRQIG